MSRRRLVFLKIGGSLMGDKTRPGSFRAAVVARVGREVALALRRDVGLRVVLAHGGGGLAHCLARRYRTREGLAGGGGWEGFAAVRRGVIETNLRVLRALERGGLRPVLVPPSAGALARNGVVRRWDTAAIERLLAADRVPLIHGDVVLDDAIGFTICSGEALLGFLARRLRPAAVVLACDVDGVYCTDTGGRVVRLAVLHRANRAGALRRMSAPPRRGRVWDVTGGMPDKIARVWDMARRDHALEGRIVSGLRPGAVGSALAGRPAGTRVTWSV